MNQILLDRFPFRLGTTSYIIPDDILPNVRFLAEKVRDVELVLFDVDTFCNIPTTEQIAELNAITARHDLSFTVHLPLDLKFSGEMEKMDESILKAKRVIKSCLPLSPRAFVLHLDSHAIPMEPSEAETATWIRNCVRSLHQLLPCLPDPALLAVENLESYPPSLNHAVLDQVPVSECIDVGHLWLQGINAPDYLAERIERTRVIHLHGIGTRDHQSLALMPYTQVKAVIDQLITLNYRGVVTLEVFSEGDFVRSQEVLGKIA